ncbi:hypothetical protein [Pseudomonas aeruginosa]|uniref:hypothetical protein n=1 Tax=Pseudomonas aeruginosa TaxID=287 RepID=UPI0014047330|nr:hypothetical protein [Pseudomonas aeruginosa]
MNNNKKEYYDYTDEFKLSGMDYRDWYDLQTGKLKREEDILPELFLDENEQDLNEGVKI